MRGPRMIGALERPLKGGGDLPFRRASSITTPSIVQSAASHDSISWAKAPTRAPLRAAEPREHTPRSAAHASPLSILPLSAVLRSLVINSISCSPLLLPSSLSIMSRLAHSTSPLLSPDRNPLLRWLLKRTVYAQFCAGESPDEVRRTVSGLQAMGYRGVILAYAKETVIEHQHAVDVQPPPTTTASVVVPNEIDEWKKGTQETVKMAAEGDYVAIKFTGAGSQTMFHLSQGLPPPPVLDQAMHELCQLASVRRVTLIIDAEQHAVQAAIDQWAVALMRRYNQAPGKATVCNSYQAYLKATPSVLAQHLSIAQRAGFTLGVKLVRGAYMASDPRYIFNDTKAQTDEQYDGLVSSLMRTVFTPVLPNPPGHDGSFPRVELVLASHNQVSIRKAQEMRRSQSAAGRPIVNVAYAQLLGMADNISCELLQAGRDAASGELPQVYKYVVWGSTAQCLKYLYRRAVENRDAVTRTRDVRNALAQELWRRIRRGV
ncbi:MAG: proline dehydrogenase [Thelocarpon superellum]|nr:MAG: proline dehydrogenase [Thelocarpon superellum]